MLNICLVGFKGYWAKYLERNIRNTPGVKLTALVDPLAVENLNTDPIVTRHLHAALNHCDAVVIATPPNTHYSIAHEAITAGKHVLIEKPMTTNSLLAHTLNETAKAYGVKIAVDHTFLFSSHIRVMKQIIAEGKIGDVQRIVSNRFNLGKFQDSGVVWDLMPHDIAMTNFLMGSRPTVRSVEFLRHRDPDVVDTAQISMMYGNVSYGLNLSWLYPKKVRNTVVIGTKAMIEYDMLADLPLRLYDKKAEKGNTAWIHSFNWVSEYQGEAKEPLSVLIEEFRDYCLGGTEFISKGDLGAEVVECIEETLKAETL